MKKILNNARNSLVLGVPVLAGLAGSVTAFAEEVGTPGVAITTEMLAPITDAITANIGVILPVGIAIFGIMIGISLIPKLISKFTK